MDKSAQYRMGYYTLTPNGMFTPTVAARPFDENEKDQFVLLTKIALDLQPMLRAFEIVELSHREIRIGLDAAVTLFKASFGSPFGGIPLIQDAQLLVYQKVMTFLSSVRSFLEHTRTALARLYGNNAPERTAFATHTSKCFDENFSYRFLEGLRNLSQHMMLPISIINLNLLRDPTTGTVTYNVSIIMDAAALLNESFNWNAKVRHDLKTTAARFDLLPILDREMTLIRELFCGCLSHRESDIQECNEYLAALSATISPPDDAVPVLWAGSPTQNGVPPNFFAPPFDDMRRIANIMRENVKDNSEA